MVNTVMMNMADLRTIAWIAYFMFILLIILLIIYQKGDPVKALAWITVISLVPVAGVILYILFGLNYRKRKLFSRKEMEDVDLQLEILSARQLFELNNFSMQRPEIVRNRDIITLLLNNNKSLLSARNRVRILNNGTVTFQSIKEELLKAKSSIHLEYYIFAKDKIGREIANILMKKAAERVEVRMIYDDVGSWGLSRRFIHRLRRSGIKVHTFMPVVFPWLTSKVNYRNHRKIITIDGRIGFTGGINIANRYQSGTRSGIWRDTHLMIEGESVSSLQVTFMTDWFFVCGEKLTRVERYFPEPEVDIETPVQIVASGPDSDWASIMQAFFAAINKAKDHIYIATPYFLPNQAILTALKVASLSGVDVRIMIPYHSDSKIIHWATQSYISELLDAGIKVYQYKKGFNHSKLLMIDGLFSSVGTANMDNRSFEDNFEVTAILYDEHLTSCLESDYLNDLRDSELVSKNDWNRRTHMWNLREAFARLLSPLL